MSIFNRSKNSSSASAAAPQVVSCCLCGSQVLDDDEHRTKLKDGKFACMDCLRKQGMPGMHDNAFGSDGLRRYIDGRSDLIAVYRPTRSVIGGLFEIDRNHDAFSLKGNIFRYEQLLNYELMNETWPRVWDLGKSVETNRVCSYMGIRISLRNAHMAFFDIPLIGGDIYADVTTGIDQQPAATTDYVNMRNLSEYCLTNLEQIQDTVRAHEREELMAAIAGAAAPSAADEIRKFHQLAEDGIISQEEFESKKQQLLEG